LAGAERARTESVQTSCEEARFFGAGDALLYMREGAQDAGCRTQDEGHDCFGGSSSAGSGRREEAVCTFPQASAGRDSLSAGPSQRFSERRLKRTSDSTWAFPTHRRHLLIGAGHRPGRRIRFPGEKTCRLSLARTPGSNPCFSVKPKRTWR
jgi:hypothetical protein